VTTVAYIANEFPSPLEPYVMDEISELRRRGVEVICCSGKRVAPYGLNLAERAFWKETRYFQPLSDDQLVRAAIRLARSRGIGWEIMRPLLTDRKASFGRRLRTLGHSLMGSAMAEELSAFGVEHVHCHHAYFASWMALVAARLLGIGFSITLHGSDLLQRADLLAAKLAACRFCVTVSEFNRQHILRNYPETRPEKILTRRLGVDRVLAWPMSTETKASEARSICLLAVGRLHPVKNYRFLIDACSVLRSQGLNFSCSIAGEGPERGALERQIERLGLQEQVNLAGHVVRHDLAGYYNRANLIVSTSSSEGIPVALMEAMSHRKLVLAPAITGIPELIEHGRTGFLYEPGSMASFVERVNWICAHQPLLQAVGQAAAAKVAEGYDRQRNLRAFVEQFLARISDGGNEYAHPLLQQVRLSV